MDPETPTPVQPERRAYPREPIDVHAMVLMIQQGMTLAGCVTDLSLSGCSLRMDKDCRSSLRSTVEVIFKVNGIAFRLFGITQWVEGKRIIGIRFGQMPDRRRTELAEVIEELAAERAAKAPAELADQPPAPDVAASNILPEIPPEKAPERSQIKQAEPRESLLHKYINPTKPNDNPVALAPAVQPASAPSFDKRDRRAQARHSVDSSAIIFLIDVMARVSGRILDVSVAGCLIHTDERFPVGIYRRVEVEFQIDGLPFRLAGVTQVVRDRNTVGVRFLNLSPRKLEQLAMLVEEIDEVHKNHENAADAEQAQPT